MSIGSMREHLDNKHFFLKDLGYMRLVEGPCDVKG